MRRKISLVTGMALGCLVAIQSPAQKTKPVSNRYTDAMNQLQRAVNDSFYLPGKNLFRERVPSQKQEHPYSYLWPLCGLVQAANEREIALQQKGAVDSVLASIESYRDTRLPATGYASYATTDGGGDRFYDDNEWIAIAVLNAWERTHKKAYLDQGKLIYQFIFSGRDTVLGDGLYWKEGDKGGKNTCSNAPGALVALELYKDTKDKAYLDAGLAIYQWTNSHLQSPEGLFYDNIKTSNRHIDRTLFSYNTGAMLEANVYLYEITGKQAYLDTAQRIATAAAGYFYAGGKFRDGYWFNAVLLKAYQHLYQHTHDAAYLKQAAVCTQYALANNRLPCGLMGTPQPKELVEQAGMLEILARLAVCIQ